MDLVGIKKALLKVWIFVGGGAVLSACQTSDLIFYEHEPSSRFYQDLNMGAPSLDPFFDDGIFLLLV